MQSTSKQQAIFAYTAKSACPPSREAIALQLFSCLIEQEPDFYIPDKRAKDIVSMAVQLADILITELEANRGF